MRGRRHTSPPPASPPGPGRACPGQDLARVVPIRPEWAPRLLRPADPAALRLPSGRARAVSAAVDWEVSVAAHVRLALVDRSPLFTRGLQLLLPAVTDARVQVVASTEDPTLAGGLVRRHRPDLAVVDVDMPEPAGLRAIAEIRRVEPDVPVLAMGEVPAAADDGEVGEGQAVAALEAGAAGYLRKTTEPEDFVSPLLAVVDGWAVVPLSVLQRLLVAAQRPRASEVGERLTEEERLLWRLVAAGWTTQRIAVRLHVSERTAKRLIANLLRRLDVSSRTEAASLAGRAGLFDGEPLGGAPFEVRSAVVRPGAAPAGPGPGPVRPRRPGVSR